MRSPVVIFALSAALLAPAARAERVPFQKTSLDNGLTVIVHEDHTLPLVAVNLVYRVGSRDEEPRRTGFAHLFEHLMFMGTKRVPPKAFDAWMEAAGGSNNAWTSTDLTDYHETGPTGILPLLLYLEADRLSALGGEIDQAKLDLQRDVVRNERRQSIENVPYGKVELRLPELMYPKDHPYFHPVIGSHEDLEAAEVKDVRAFFDRYYVPRNASLVVAGDVTYAEAVAEAMRLFGPIPGGTRAARMSRVTPPPLGRVVREALSDEVELPKVVMAFHSPAHLDPGDAELDLVAAVLSSGKASRLYRALVFEKKLAQDVSAAQSSSGLSSQFVIEARARPGVSAEALEAAIDEVLRDLLAKAPTPEELRRARAGYEHALFRGLQAVAARARLLNLYEVEVGDPGYFEKDLARYEGATTQSLHDWAKKTLTLDARVVLHVVPKSPSRPPAAGAKKGGGR